MKTSIENDEISLKELKQKTKEWLKYLYSKSIVIAISIFLGALLGLIYSISNKPVYTATLSFALEDEKAGGGGLGSALGLASSLGIDLGGSGGSIFTGSNLTELFKSRTMVVQTLLKPVSKDGKVISLAEMYIQNAGWRENWDRDSKLKQVNFIPNNKKLVFTRVQDSILGVIYQNISKGNLSVAQKDKKIAIITIDVASNDEQFSKSFCEALVGQVSEFYVETKSKKARMNMDILEFQLDSIRRELNGAITGVAIANDNTFGLNPALNIRRTPSARRQVDVQANTAILTELVKQSEIAKVTLRKETPLIQIVDRPILPLPVEHFGKIKGIITGALLFGFLTILFLIIKQIFN
ncbi:lipopolysaccharide biosynthesis protein [Flavobacterium hungaricum]|uniref:Lipopolysaccharide biosynthesis protein n=1 Tax=Flavobacterium hungaricum TaxID=2082725 RepID=A0ABR9TQV4_9FLAO|nr:lipopolysaccharide biosynthesis protein [Flavobacterium hungaricum]MBE8727757.1 lipopolysaccharide biosynthesis protein [Flavobacterium hungaricum]